MAHLNSSESTQPTQADHAVSCFALFRSGTLAVADGMAERVSLGVESETLEYCTEMIA
jgi:hypothetical protein